MTVRIELTPSNRRPTRATFSRLEVNLYTIYTSAGGTVYTSNSAPQHIAQEQEHKYVHYLQEHCVIVLSFLAWLCFGISRFAFGQPLLRRLSVAPFDTGAVRVSGHITDMSAVAKFFCFWQFAVFANIKSVFALVNSFWRMWILLVLTGLSLSSLGSHSLSPSSCPRHRQGFHGRPSCFYS